MLTPYTLASLPSPGTPGRLVTLSPVQLHDGTVWVDTGWEWREATEEEVRTYWEAMRRKNA